MKEKKIYETSHIQETAWLIVNKFKPEAFFGPSGLVMWKFEDTPKLRKSIAEFNSDGTISVAEFCKTIAMLKTGMKHMQRHRNYNI